MEDVIFDLRLISASNREVAASNMEDRMRAVRLHDYGRQAGLIVETVEDPVPRDDQLLIRVAAASWNPVDWKVVDGMLRAFMTFDLPVVPGGDVSGLVVGVGRNVSG